MAFKKASNKANKDLIKSSSHYRFKADTLKSIIKLCTITGESQTSLLSRLIDTEIKNIETGTLSLRAQITSLFTMIEQITQNTNKANRVAEVTLMAIMNYHLADLEKRKPEEDHKSIMSKLIKLINEYLKQNPQPISEIDLRDEENQLMMLLSEMVSGRK